MISTIQDHITSFETSVKLYAIGVPDETQFSYYKQADGAFKIAVTGTIDLPRTCPAYTATELINLLPASIPVDKKTFLSREMEYTNPTEEELITGDGASLISEKTEAVDTPYMTIYRFCGTMIAYSLTPDGRYNNLISWGTNEAESRADMLLKLIKERVVKY